jgi:hypothetical protein
MTRLKNQTLILANLDIARATQYFDLLWGHAVNVDMTDAYHAADEDRIALLGLLNKPVKISLSIEEV